MRALIILLLMSLIISGSSNTCIVTFYSRSIVFRWPAPSSYIEPLPKIQPDISDWLASHTHITILDSGLSQSDGSYAAYFPYIC